MYLNCSCLLVIKNSFINSLSILYLDFLLVSHKISVWYCFLILDNFVCTNRNVLKLSNAVLISYRRNINLTSCVRCSSQVELDTLDILLPLCSLVNCDRACLLVVEYFCVNSFCINNCYLFFIGNEIAVWHCFFVLDDTVCTYRYVLKNCYAVLIGSCRNVYFTSCV